MDRKSYSFFNKLKSSLVSVLKFFDNNSPVLISVDSSKDGLGAVLMQKNLPCAYASKALTETQKRYAQIEKEMLAILYGCEKFYQYVFGRPFTVETDHKPLISIFKKPLMSCPAGLQRMLIKLQKFEITFVYKRGKDLIIADALSRSSEKFDKDFDLNFENDLEAQVCLVKYNVNMTDSKNEHIKQETIKDPDMICLKSFIQNGWPNTQKKIPVSVKPYAKY